MSNQQQKRYSRGDVIAKKYEIERFLGEGMIASSYLAQHITSQKQLVIKFIRPNLVSTQRDRDRLRRLFERARTVRHELLTRYGEMGTHEDSVYITEEYFASESLRQVVNSYVAEGKVFTLQEACQIAINILEASEIGHNAGLIHRNAKPENVLVHTRRTGPAANAKIVRTIKVSGLGLASVVSPTIFAESFLSREEAHYLAPELSGFDQEGGPQADVYSVGVILYELLCGQRPMGTYLSPTQLRDDLPEHIDDIVEIALAHNPEDRYPSPRDMINDIQRSFSLEMQQGSRTVSFRSFLIGLGIAVALVVAVGSYLVVTDRPDPMVQAQQQDELIRKKVQADNPLPPDMEVLSMIKLHPEMVYVPGGTFIHGRLKAESLDAATSSEPITQVLNVDAFYIDRYEFPNLKGSKPAARVSWKQASDTCTEMGKRLCTDLEWEKSCKGPGNFVYAYGDEFSPDICGADQSNPYTLGARTDCVSAYGVYDMSGGIREWTSTTHRGKETRRLVKGGLRGNGQRGTRCAFAVDEGTAYADSTLGFRCCLTPEEGDLPGGSNTEGVGAEAGESE